MEIVIAVFMGLWFSAAGIFSAVFVFRDYGKENY